MTLFITPEIGSSGKYTYKAPYDTLGNNQTEFKCMSIKTLVDCLSSGEDPYKKYYEPYKLTQQDYKKDLVDSASIIGLQSAVGQWLYIPNSYLLSFPDVSGVRYVNMVLAANIGAIPETMNLDTLISEVEDAIIARLGITPEIKSVITSQPALIGYDDHMRLEGSRMNLVRQESPLIRQVIELKTMVNVLTEQNIALSEFIKSRNMTP